MESVAVCQDFNDVVLPHLEAANRLARWLMGNESDAEDVVQEASLRAFRYFRTFTGGDARAWFLRIVRNVCHDWRRLPERALTEAFDEEQHGYSRRATSPESLLLQSAEARAIERAMNCLPHRFRHLLVLRELEGLSYRELAGAIDAPIGTVMSSLSRARQALREALDIELEG
jgi:RNA polymerase sigma-70 factor (ECF subfamily)